MGRGWVGFRAGWSIAALLPEPGDALVVGIVGGVVSGHELGQALEQSARGVKVELIGGGVRSGVGQATELSGCQEVQTLVGGGQIREA